MGAQYAPQHMTPRPSPSSNGSEMPPIPEAPFVPRPPRKSSLVPISDSIRLSSGSGSESPNRPPLTRESSASSLQIPTVKTLKAKRSMPELQLDRVWESFVEETNEAVITPTRREFGRDADVVRGTNRRQRASSSASEQPSLKQRFSNLPESPAPTVALPSLPTGGSNTPPVVDLTSPRKSHFGSPHTSPRNAHFGPEATGSVRSFAYPSTKDASRLNPSPVPEDPRSTTPMSMSSTEVTLSMFPQPPPLTIRHHRPSRPTSPSQYPITPDYSPSATPTSPTFHHQAKRTSPPTSILKKPSSFYNPLPSPPITPNSSFASSRSGSNGSLSKLPIISPGPDPVAPTLRIRASSPYLPSAKPTPHTAHRPSSSDSSSDKSAFPASSSSSEWRRMEQQNLRKRAMSRPEIPPAQKAVFQASLLETTPYPQQSTSYQTQTSYDTRPVSPETVQWGYAV